MRFSTCDGGSGKPRIQRAAWRSAISAVAILLILGAKPLRPYRTPEAITKSLATSAHVGDCDACHTMHGKGEVVYERALRGPNENTLCDRCHDTPWAGGSYAGTVPYASSSHGSGPGTVWPGPLPPPRTEPGAAGKCLNCHDPHGWSDAAGTIPMLTIVREEALCLACHDAAPAATDIATDLRKPFAHPVTSLGGRHAGPGESQPADFAVTPADRRHAECGDCHNPHLVSHDRTPPGAPALARANLGVSRVLVLNGAAGTPPTFTFAPGADTLTAPVAEYQVCFKCHSSWTRQPTGQTDLAVALNPANASYHPVEAPGRDPLVPGSAFAPGWSPSSLTRCGDCHGSESPAAPRGVHGSIHRYLLKRPYEASSQPRVVTPGDLCFSCHAYPVYADPSSPAALRAASRFNAPGTLRGHAEHSAASVPCYACHITHGAAYRRHLLVTGRVPGITAFTETPTGGTCQPTCHAPQSYTANYAR